jgi:cell division protein FtsB
MQLIEINDNTYRQCDVRYNGVRVSALILESEYQKARSEKQAHKRPKTKRKEIDGNGSLSHSGLRKKAWHYFSKYIRQRDDYVCCTCGNYTKLSSLAENEDKLKEHIKKYPFAKPVKVMQAGHFLPKGSYRGLYFNEEDVHAQCSYCNMNMQDPEIYNKYLKYMIEKYGKNKIERLKAIGKQGGYRRSDLEMIIYKYK